MLPTLQLTDAFKGYTYDQDKLMTPEETVRRVRERLAALDLEILAETMRIDSGRLDIPVYISLLGADARRVVPTQKQMGKGATPVQAEASALMELVERFSFFTFIEEGPKLYTTARDLGDQALPFSYLARSLFDHSPDLRPRRGALSGLAPPFRPGHQPEHRGPGLSAPALVLPDRGV